MEHKMKMAKLLILCLRCGENWVSERTSVCNHCIENWQQSILKEQAKLVVAGCKSRCRSCGMLRSNIQTECLYCGDKEIPEEKII